MKELLFLLLYCVPLLGLSQDSLNFDPELFFQCSSSDFDYIWLNDSISTQYEMELIESERIWNPDTFDDKNAELLSFSSTYLIKDGRKVSIHGYPDKQLIVYKEYATGGNENELSAIGILRFDPNHFAITTYPDYNMKGEDTLYIDTTFNLIKTGTWIQKYSSAEFEKGEYNNNLKEGKWTIYLQKRGGYFNGAIKAEHEFNEGVCVRNQKIDLVEDSVFIRKNIVDKWYYKSARVSYNNSNTSWVFYTKDSTKAVHVRNGIWYELDFYGDSTVQFKRGFRCGNGIKPEDVQNTIPWRIYNGNLLYISGYNPIKIIYMSENEMILEY